ncbi:MAG TPA: hypothetical protein VH592_21065 [Gemmataceae bacterium]|jgi:hypothetical protein
MQLLIDVYAIGPLGFVAQVQEVLPDGAVGEVLYKTRIYAEREVVLDLARAWVAESEWPPAA